MHVLSSNRKLHKKVSLVFIFVAIVVLFNLLLVNFCCIFVVTFFYPIL